MIKMGRTLDELGKSVKTLMQERAARQPLMITPANVEDIFNHLARTHGHSVPIQKPGGIMSTIEHDNKGTTFKVDVKFRDNEQLTQPDRMKKCEKFLVAIESMLSEHDVVEFNGAYVRTIQA